MPQYCYCEERTIAASAATVWDAIAGFAQYPDWNPWIRSATGGTAPGDRVCVTARFAGRGGTYRHRMVASTRPTLFHWRDTGWFTRFADGERIRHLTPLGEAHCHYRVELRVRGIAAGLADALYGRFMRGGLAAEADALQAYAERLARG